MKTVTPEQRHAEYAWLTAAEVAELLACGPDMVRDLIRDRKLKAMNISRSKVPRYRVHPDELARFIKESEENVGA